MKITSIQHFVLFATIGCLALSLARAESTDIVVIGAKPPASERPKTVPPITTEGGTPVVAAPGTVQILEMPEITPVLTEGKAPIGAVMAWVKSMPKTPKLPGGWVECNGQEIKDPGSPYKGQLVPNLNGANGQPNRFLRGAVSTGATGGSTEHSHSAVRAQKYGDSRKPVAGIMRGNHLPPYFDVVWIMRVK